jgi:hypothetical protein
MDVNMSDILGGHVLKQLLVPTLELDQIAHLHHFLGDADLRSKLQLYDPRISSVAWCRECQEQRAG